MKKLFFTAFLFISMTCIGQNVQRDANGNFKAISTPKNDSTEAKATNYTYTDKKGEILPVYVSSKGKYFVIRISKNGNSYRYYLKF